MLVFCHYKAIQVQQAGFQAYYISKNIKYYLLLLSYIWQKSTRLHYKIHTLEIRVQEYL